MANCYYVDLIVRGPKQSLDELQAILQEEIDGGQTGAHYYTMDKSLRRMGYDPDKLDWRSYTEECGRNDDKEMWVRYVGAWSPKPQVLIAIQQRWPDVDIDWRGVDEFGQYPESNDPQIDGYWHVEDEDEGLNPFCESLSYWDSEERTLKVVNDYYQTHYMTLGDAFDGIPKLEHYDPMQLYTEDLNDIEAVKAAKLNN